MIGPNQVLTVSFKRAATPTRRMDEFDIGMFRFLLIFIGIVCFSWPFEDGTSFILLTSFTLFILARLVYLIWLKEIASNIWVFWVHDYFVELRECYEEGRKTIHSFLAGDARPTPTGRLGGYRQMESGHQYWVLDLPRAEADITYERSSEELESLVERKVAERQEKAKRSEAAKKGWRTRKAKEAEAKRLRRHSSKHRIESAFPPAQSLHPIARRIREKDLKEARKKWT